MKRVGIVGTGNIGACLEARLKAQGDEVCFTTDQHYSRPIFSKMVEWWNPDAVCLAIPTRDTGEAERDYILATVADHSIPVVTCGKGALAHHAGTIKPYLPKVGFSAAVGGGTGMLPYTRWRNPNGGPVRILVVLNGTFNYVLSEMGRMHQPLGPLCNHASRLGIAEPGATDPVSLVNGELKDVVRKTCAFYNVLLATKRFVSPNDCAPMMRTPEDVALLSEVGGKYRVVVSFTNLPREAVQKPEFLGTGFEMDADGWHISGGFRALTDLPDISWLPSGAGNAVHLVEGEFGDDGTYTSQGDGAGPGPTTRAMVNDLNMLCL